MLELPEVITIAKQINQHIAGKRVQRVFPPTKSHKFCWYAGDPADYDTEIRGSTVVLAEGFGIYVEMIFDNGKRLCFNDGVNPRLMNRVDVPKNHQLLIEFDDGTALVSTIAMYGGIILHDGNYDNEYYVKSKTAISPLTDEFKPYFYQLLTESKGNLSTKAFLATGQRIAGIGNGVLQDILFSAGVHPKRKIETLGQPERDKLQACIVSVLRDMIEGGGRDTEKDLFGLPGGYRVRLSKNTLASDCPQCGGPILKENYMGGSVYFCPVCQPLAERK